MRGWHLGLLLLLLFAPIAGAQAPCCTWAPYSFIYVGDSLSVGADDGRYPRDEGECDYITTCTGPPSLTDPPGIRATGFAGAIENQWKRAQQGLPHVLPGGSMPYSRWRSAEGGRRNVSIVGKTMWNWNEWSEPIHHAFYTTNVNDRSTAACGGECIGGFRPHRQCADGFPNSTEACPRLGDQDATGSYCDGTTGTACTDVLYRDSHAEMIDFFLKQSSIHSIQVFKTPAWVDGQLSAPTWYDPANDNAFQFMFSDTCPGGAGNCGTLYDGNARVHYSDEFYRYICEASGLQDCPPTGTDRTGWLFAKDGNATSGTYVHLNAWGYMEMARFYLAALHARTPDQIDTKPSSPSLGLDSVTTSSITVDVGASNDADGPFPVPDIYVWAVCTDLSSPNRGDDYGCQPFGSTLSQPDCFTGGGSCNGSVCVGGNNAGLSCSLITIPHDCGDIRGGDHNGLGASTTSDNLNYEEPDYQIVSGAGGQATIPGLASGVEYKVCATAYDGFVGSDFSELTSVTTD